MQVALTGRFISAPPERDYSFVPEGEDDKLEGTTRKAWVYQDEKSAPVVVKFDDDHSDEFGKVRALFHFGDAVSWNVEAGRSVKFASFIDAEPVRPLGSPVA